MAERRAWALCLALMALLAGVSLPACAEAPPADILSEALIACTVLEETPDFSGLSPDAPFILYGAPDALGRATGAVALLDRDCLTLAERPDLSGLSPTGLHNARYRFIEGGWVYNRCHLIGHRFGGASDLENLITGTHALNYSYMLPWEDQLADYLRQSCRRAFYRVTPLYEGNELVCRSVRLEARSLDDRLCFAVLCPNAQPGVAIDYATGYTTQADGWSAGGTQAGPRLHILNTRTRKFHLEGCAEAGRISRFNRAELLCPREELLQAGWIPCGKCRP